MSPPHWFARNVAAVLNPDGTVGFGSLTHWKAARARVHAGQADAKLLCVGDSTTGGCGGNAAQPSWQGVPESYPYQLAAMLNYGGLPAAPGLAVPRSAYGPSDGRWANTSGWASVPMGWGGGGVWENAGDGQQLIYIEPTFSDRFDVYYLTAPDAGSFTVGPFGGATTTVDAAGPAGVGKVTMTAPSAKTGNDATVTPANGDGQVHIVGIEAWLSTAPRVRVGNAGIGGSTAGAWAADPAAGAAFSAAACIRAYAPDLTVISLGINDAGGNGTVASLVASLATLAAAARASGDVALLLPVLSRSTAPAPFGALIPQYAAAQRAMHLPYADTARIIGSGDAFSARGGMADDMHPNAAGYAVIAQALAAALLS